MPRTDSRQILLDDLQWKKFTEAYAILRRAYDNDKLTDFERQFFESIDERIGLYQREAYLTAKQFLTFLGMAKEVKE